MAVEAEFVREADMRNRKPILRILVIVMIVIFFEFFISENYSRLGSANKALRAVSWTRVATFSISAIFLIWAFRGRKAISAGISVCWAIALSLSSYTSDHLRMSTLAHVSCEPYCEVWDGRFLLWQASLVVGVGSFMGARSSRLWVLPLTQALIYILFSLPGVGPLPFARHVETVAIYLVLCCCIWLACYRNEDFYRQRWCEARDLRLEVAAQKSAYESQQQLLHEVNERLEAMSAVANVTAKSTPTADAQDRNAVTSTGSLTVPPPPTNFRDEPESPGGDREKPVPNKLLAAALAGRICDVARVRKMAARIRHADYGMRAFFEDCLAAFPELGLFHAVSRSVDASNQTCTTLAPQGMTSGRTRSEEYQRTIGALFAVYWLLRLDMDGRRGFCYGLDEDWKIRTGPPEGEASPFITRATKRRDFMANADWTAMENLVARALGDNQQRIEALLCLTSFHDCMKLPELCPVVAAAHAPYHGFPEGTKINDHDLALAYVLEFYPELMPSYSMLPEVSRELVLFTKSKLHFNHGWFVQAEAPPGAMLRSLKMVLSRATHGDLSFYFLHWLTDLSGAEGTPLGGAEKFVLKFPRPVLGAFLWSMPYLQKLKTDTETSVVESYLLARWRNTFPQRIPPTGRDSVARLRIAVMAQHNAPLACAAFDKLPAGMRKALSEEMARTGIADQYYQSCPVWGGPAFLIYYGPALLQRCHGEDEVLRALRRLAAVYVAGRSLWPLDRKALGETITLEVGQLSARGLNLAQDRTDEQPVFVLLPRNSKEAHVDVLAASGINTLNTEGVRYRVLNMHPADSEDTVVPGLEGVQAQAVALVPPPPTSPPVQPPTGPSTVAAGGQAEEAGTTANANATQATAETADKTDKPPTVLSAVEVPNKEAADPLPQRLLLIQL